MGKRQKAWARRWRNRLLAIFGNRCVDCGSTENLEFDCIEPRGDYHHKGEISTRISFYRRQHREFNLTVRCKTCNSAKADKEPKVPF